MFDNLYVWVRCLITYWDMSYIRLPANRNIWMKRMRLLKAVIRNGLCPIVPKSWTLLSTSLLRDTPGSIQSCAADSLNFILLTMTVNISMISRSQWFMRGAVAVIRATTYWMTMIWEGELPRPVGKYSIRGHWLNCMPG